MTVSCGFYVEHSRYGVGPYILIKTSFTHSEVPTANAVNAFADMVVNEIISNFPIANVIKAVLEAIYGKLTPTIAGHDNGNGVVVEVRAPMGGVGVPYSKVYPRDNAVIAPPNEDGIVLYKHSLYRGSWVYFAANTDVPHLSEYNMNDKVSSIKINGPIAFIAYQHADYQGRALLVNGNIPKTSKYGFHDSLSSIKVFQPTKGITVYKDINYEGVSSFLTASIEHTSSLGLNDNISSILLHYGATCKIFQHADFRGRSKDITTHCPRLSSIGFNDTISSIRIY